MDFDTFDRTGSVDFPYPKSVVFRAVREAVKGLKGMRTEALDELASRIDIKTGISAFSWGEVVAVSVVAKDFGTATVSIQSAAKTIFGSAVAHGKNRENIKNIIKRTSELLSNHGREWADEKAASIASAKPRLQKTQVGSIADELAKLLELKNLGVLTSQEFDAQKSKLLGQ